MRAFVFVSALVFSYFINEITASFDALIKFENVTAIWQNEKKSDQLYLVYPLEGGKVLYPLKEKFLRYFCWISPPEKHTESEINALPLMNGETIEIGISSGIDKSNHNANHIDKNLHIFQLAERQHKLVLGVNRIPFSKLVR
jgi:hypothetical protein